ncbi:MAG: DUF1284 domain-containing protein [Ruminococcus sp.]|nr:DUF1284 domain-containing protein [Ruminococcus sp.]
MDLRPHHLLCTQGYSGKGYSEEFVDNMNRLTAQLRGEEPVRIQLCFSTDDLCTCCPNKQGENQCSTNEKVLRFDRKTVEYFQLEEREYIYQELIAQIQKKVTPEMLADICSDCAWYPVSACREKILKRYHENRS